MSKGSLHLTILVFRDSSGILGYSCVFSLEEEPEGQRVSECLGILPTGAGEMAQDEALAVKSKRT